MIIKDVVDTIFNLGGSEISFTNKSLQKLDRQQQTLYSIGQDKVFWVPRFWPVIVGYVIWTIKL